VQNNAILAALGMRVGPTLCRFTPFHSCCGTVCHIQGDIAEQGSDFNLPVGQPFQIAPVILTAPMPPSEGYR
jgi:hypothetical protein